MEPDENRGWARSCYDRTIAIARGVLTGNSSPNLSGRGLMSVDEYAVAIVVDPGFGDRLLSLAERLPVWAVESPANRRVSYEVKAPGSPQHPKFAVNILSL
jgi:hypothetical protein